MPQSRKAKEQNSQEEIIRNPSNYVKLYVTRVRGGLTSHDFRFELMNEKLKNKPSDPWSLVSDGLLILSPIGAKRFQKELTEAIKTYERSNGEIPLEPSETKVLQLTRD